MTEKLTQSAVMRAIDWAYQKSIEGIGPLQSAEQLAGEYLLKGGNLDRKARRLVNWQTAKCGTSGFLTGLGGIITLPVTIPANIASVLYVQVRMIAAVAHMGGHDLRSDQVQTLVYACLTGNAIKDIVKDTGIVIGRKLTEQGIKNISRETITKINQKVGFRLLTKFGEKGAVNLGKMIPLIGGVIGATFDVASTRVVGRVARKTFISK